MILKVDVDILSAVATGVLILIFLITTFIILMLDKEKH